MLIEAEIHAAAAVAAKIHRKDTRKYSGLPYLHHCVATAAWVRSLLRRTHYNIVSQHTDPRQAATDMVCAAQSSVDPAE
jgi:(p)ppGpp synthase/HD superfamily hydrolase